MSRLRQAVICAAGVGALLVPAADGAPGGSNEVKVKVVDFDFRPGDVRISRGEAIDFRWSSRNGTPHNVSLQSGPKGVSRPDFTSKTGTTRVNFEPVFEKPGKYLFRCTIHPDQMRLDVAVRR